MASLGYVSPYGQVRPPGRRGLPVASWRARVLLIAAGILAIGVVVTPKGVSADVISGYSTNGACVKPGTPIVLWQQSTTAYSSLSISFELRLYTSGSQPTVAQGGWVLSSGGSWDAGYWHTEAQGVAHSQYYYVGVPPGGGLTDTTTGTSVGILPGTSATAKYYIVVNGYDPQSCAAVSNVRISRTLTSGGSQTAAPGGGGFTNPTPTPAVPGATPTMPAVPTAIPGGTPGPGSVCWLNREGTNVCYPKPPTGWCYNDGGHDLKLEKCATATPTPTPGPPGCSGQAAYHDFCFEFTNQGGQFGNTGTIGTVTGWDGSDVVAMGGWITIEHTNAATSSSATSSLTGPQNIAGGCTFSGSGWATENWNVSKSNGTGTNPRTYTVSLDGTVGVKKTYTTENVSVSSGASRNWSGTCSNSSTNQSIPIAFVKSSATSNVLWSGVVFFDFNKGAPQANPTSTPVPATPTLPPNYWGVGATAPPQGAGGGAEQVDICASNPGITACAQSFPPAAELCALYPGIAACATAAPTLDVGALPTADGGQVDAAFDALASGLGQRAPFGYAAQVVDAIGGALADPAGPAVDFCFGTFEVGTSSAPFCVEDFAAEAADWRWLWAILLWIGLAFSLLWLVKDDV